MPLHLEDHLDAATVVGSEVPADLPQPIEWRFDEPQPDWTSARLPPSGRPVQTRTADALRLSVEEAVNVSPFGTLRGGTIYVDLPDWKREDWEYVLVRARTSEKVRQLRLAFNLRENRRAQDTPFRFNGESVDVINDGSVQSYLLRADWSKPWEEAWEGPWQRPRACEPTSVPVPNAAPSTPMRRDGSSTGSECPKPAASTWGSACSGTMTR
jgi:hypothetical protein